MCMETVQRMKTFSWPDFDRKWLWDKEVSAQLSTNFCSKLKESHEICQMKLQATIFAKEDGTKHCGFA